MLNPAQSIFRNILSNYLGTFAGMAVAFILTPFLINHLGKAAFGIWVLVHSFRQYFQLLELGTNQAIMKLISEYAALNKKENIAEVINTSFVIFLLAGIVSIILSFVLAHYGLIYFKIPSNYLSTSKQLVLIIGINISLLLLKRGLNASLAGYHRFDLINLITVIGELTTASITVILVRMGFGLIALAVLMVGINLLEVILLLYFLIRKYSLSIGLSFVSREKIRTIFGFSLYTFVTDISTRIAWNIDVVVIGIFLPVSSITTYTIGVRLAGISEKLFNPIINTLLPLASTWDAQEQKHRLQQLMLEGTKVSLLLSLPVAALLFLTGKSLISLWVGKEYLSSFSVLVVFLLIFVVSNMESTASQIQLGMRKLRFHTMVSIFSALANFLLSITLIHFYGIIGVALGTLVPCLISNLLFSIPYTCYIIELPLRKFIRHSVYPAFISLINPSLAVYLTNLYWKPATDLVGVIVISTIFIGLYGLTYVLFFSSPEERLRLRLRKG